MDRRWVELDTAFNLRDLGGYRASGGRVVRWGRLYRSDALCRLSEGDLAVVGALGLHTVIDLRNADEVAERGRFPADLRVHYEHAPMLDVTWGLDEGPGPGQADWEFLVRKYDEMLVDAEPRIAQVFWTLAVPGALPALFHCAAGKDRTGIVAALVLAALGVADDDVVADYALTAGAIDRLRAWAAVSDPRTAQAMAERPSAHLAAEPEAMADLLTRVRARHGGVREYLVTLGVGEAVLGRLEEELLVPAASAGAAA